MNRDAVRDALEVDDEELFEHAAGWAAALRGAAARWRFRANAGRIGRHSLRDVVRLVRSLESAADSLEPEHAPNVGAVQASDAGILHTTEERFRLLVDGVRDYAIFMLDRDGRIASWNSGAERIKGYRAEEVIGKHFSMFYPREAAARGHAHEELDIATRDGQYHEEGWRIRKDGTPFWADVTINALRSETGELRGFAKITRDLTERRAADETLRESEERFRLMVEAVQDYAIFMLDPHGRVATWNVGAERLKGYKAEEIIGKHFSVFYTTEQVEAHHPERELDLAIEHGTYAEEGWRLRKDGTRFWASITTLRGPHGSLRGFAKVTRDFTGRKKAEDDVKALNAQLEHQVRDRTAAVEALSATNKELEAFSYSVSHDLRAPLRGVDGFAKMLLQKYAPSFDDQGRHYLERIRAGTQRMAALIDELLRLSQLSRAEVRRLPLDLGAIATELSEELQKQSPERVVSFAIAQPARAIGDPQLLRIVVANLLDNAWKFTRKAQDACIEFGETARDGQRVFYVRDNGAGFDMEYADKLFAPFQRLHDVSEFEGIGIGLATVQRIIARHAGRIWAESKPTEGATFWFTLPEVQT
jgi:PAS domain S-box-containing protein